jgi:hypothetical protein
MAFHLSLGPEGLQGMGVGAGEQAFFVHVNDGGGVEVSSLGKWVWAELCLKEFISSAKVSLACFGLNLIVAGVVTGES